MAEHSEFIRDARRLPASKRHIAQAFNTLIEHYERLRVTDNVTFNSRGGEIFLDQMRALRFRISDFQEIDPEDGELVAQINATQCFSDLGERLANGQIPPTEQAAAEDCMRKALMLCHKYRQRGMREDAFLLAPDAE